MSESVALRRRRVEGGRPIKVEVKFTEAEFEAVSLRAAAARLTVPSFLAVTALRPAGVGEGDARSAVTNLVAVRRVLAGVATNLNQIAARVNGSGQVDAALPAVLDAVDRMTERTGDAVRAVAGAVGGRRV